MTAIDVGIDIGTTHLKFCAVREGHDDMVACAVRSPGWEHPRRHWTQLDAERLAANVLAGLDALVTETTAVQPNAHFRSVGITGMAESGVSLDRGGCALSPIIAWHDPRGRELLAQVPEPLRREFAGSTGLPVSDLATVFKLKWLQREGIDLVDTQWLSVPEFVAHRLGARRASEASLAGRTGLMELASATPWQPALDWLGLDPRFLPAPTRAGDPLGMATGPRLHAALKGAVITVAGHDHSVAAAAAGTGSGDLFASLGTAETIVMTLSELPPRAVVTQLVGAGLEVNPHVQPGLYAVVTGTRTGLVLNRVLRLLGIDDAAARDSLDERASLLAGDDEPVEDGYRLEGDVFTIVLDDDAMTPESLWSAAVAQCAQRIGARVELVRRLTNWDGQRAVLAGGWSEVTSTVRARQHWAKRVQVSAVTQLEVIGAAKLARRAAESTECLST